MPLALERPAVKFCCYAVYLSWRQAFGALVLSALRIVGSSMCFKMADENAVPGPSNPKRQRLDVKKKLTDSELLKILENSDSDEFDFVDGDSDGWGSSDDGEVDVDVTTQASND
ncbi:hypothetical protein JTB14_011544 [Gonioctena quinquepunctata]|nr:hypothetical protein JTB14_011544 [Gonioctena quinquepunctata]